MTSLEAMGSTESKQKSRCACDVKIPHVILEARLNTKSAAQEGPRKGLPYMLWAGSAWPNQRSRGLWALNALNPGQRWRANNYRGHHARTPASSQCCVACMGHSSQSGDRCAASPKGWHGVRGPSISHATPLPTVVS